MNGNTFSRVGLVAAVAAALSPAAGAQTTVTHFPSPSAAASGAGPAFSRAVLAGDTLYISGTLDTDPATGKSPSDPKLGAKFVMDSIRGTVEAAGLTMDDLVWVQVFATDLKHYAAFNEVYRSYFKGPLPARAFLGAGSLLNGANFEVMGVAARKKAAAR
jgi:2-iminobutanoate/2-iminopropanoate deaminase